MVGGIEQFAEHLYAIDDIDALRQRIVDFCLDNGVEMISYHHLPPPGATDYSSNITVAAHGFPEDWMRTYLSRKYYEIDPIPKRALNSSKREPSTRRAITSRIS